MITAGMSADGCEAKGQSLPIGDFLSLSDYETNDQAAPV